VSHQDTLKTCEELLATLSAAETHLRVTAALQLDFSSVLKVYRDALTRSRDLVAPVELESSSSIFVDLGGRDDTDEVLTLAVGGPAATDDRVRPTPAISAGQTAVNAPAVPIDDGPEGTTDDSTPLATDEISIEAQAPKIIQSEPPADDVVIMEEDEAVATEVMTPSEARARALALAADEDSHEPPTEDSIDIDDEHTLVVTEDHLELLPEDTTQPGSRVDLIVEAELEEEDDQGSVDEVIVSKDQARAEARTPAQGGQKTPAPAPAASTPPPAASAAKPKVKARVPEKGKKEAASAKFYAASAAIPQIRDESTPKPRAAAIKLGAEGRPAEVLGGEDDDEPIAIEGVEDEDALDHSGDGLSLEVDDMSDWEEEDAEEEVDLLELDAEHLEEVEEHVETAAQSFSRDQLADTLDRARRAAKQGNIEVGVNFFSDVLDADPDNVEAYIGRGRLYLDVGDYARAMSDFTVAEDLDPRSPEPQVAVGDLYFARKDYKKAIEYFDQALQMKPDHAMAFCRRGISHYYKKNYKQALGDLNEAVRLDKDIPNIQTFVSMAKKKVGKPTK